MTHPETAKLVEAIEEVYPDLRVSSARPIRGQGQNSRVIVVNDALIFRFPRYAGGVAELEREIRILRSIDSAVPLATPDPVYTALGDPLPGRAFIGYPMIPGQPLQREALDSLEDSSVLSALGQQAGAFLRELHAVPLGDLLPNDVATFDPLRAWRDLYRRIADRLFPLMRPDARSATVEHFEAFFDRNNDLTISPVLVHGDFGTGNLLFDARTRRLTGVVDFESAGVGDPAIDFAAFSSSPAPFLAGLSLAYPLVTRVTERILFYRATFALQEALFGIEHGDEVAFCSGMATYI